MLGIPSFPLVATQSACPPLISYLTSSSNFSTLSTSVVRLSTNLRSPVQSFTELHYLLYLLGARDKNPPAQELLGWNASRVRLQGPLPSHHAQEHAPLIHRQDALAPDLS